jgi:hypothetical protein
MEYNSFYEYNPETEETTLPTIDNDPSNASAPDTGFSGTTFDNPQTAEDGTQLFLQPDGSYVDASGVTVITPDGKVVPGTSYTGFGGALPPGSSATGGIDFSSTIKNIGTDAFNAVKSLYTKKVNGQDVTDWKAIAATAGGLYGLSQSQKPQDKTGYLGGIPKYEAVREQVANTYDPNRRPGSAAQTYFTNTKYVAPENAGAARAAAVGEAAGLEALNKANPAQQSRPVLQAGALQTQPTSLVAGDAPVPQYAAGGIAGLPKSGAKASQGRYLSGETDGMADKIPAKIDGKQEARLSHGEFVIPADVVGHLGNGNSEAGAKRLYEMMDRIRHARTGTTKQGKQINSDKFLPK